ncbi:hypothetical protein ACFLTT_01440 [Chloroflexota bacterium]
MNRILIFSHYLGALKYLDELYHELENNNCEVVYGFWQESQFLGRMIEYCESNSRKYYRLHYQGELFYNRMLYRLSVNKMLDKLKPDIVIQTDDMHFFQNEIVHRARDRNIPTLVIQWALTMPEEIHVRSKERNRSLKKATESKVGKIIKGTILYINRIINKLLGLDYGNKLSIAQGDSDKVAVINEYSKDLFIKQGVNEEKIAVTGHFELDSAVAALRKNPVRKLDTVKILYISDPFYTKDLKRITLIEQLEYVKKVYSSAGSLLGNYCFYLKLHPAEYVEDYSEFKDLPNLVLKENFDTEISINNSDLIICSASTLLMSAVAAGKPIVTLNILNIPEVKEILEVMGIDDQIVVSWESLNQIMQLFKENPEKLVRKINPYFLLNNGQCKRRAVDLILEMMQNES